MKRKVIKQGNGTLTITLPKKWTEKLGINAGDEIEIDESDSRLVIRLDKEHILSKSITIDFKDCSPRMIKRILPVFHHSGYDEVITLYSDPSQIKAIHETINVLSGYEIIEQRPTRCVIKSLSESSELSVDKVINRMFLVLHSIVSNLKDYSEKEGSNIQEILVLELTLDRLTNHAERYINKYLPKNSVYLYVLVWNLECMGDYIRDLCKKNNSLKLNEQQKKRVVDCAEIVDNLRHLFFNFSIEGVDKLQQKCDIFLSNDIKQTHVEWALKGIIQRVHDILGSITAVNYVTTDKKQKV